MAAWQRFYLGYKERFVDDCVLELQGGTRRVRLAQAPSAKAAAKKRNEKLDKESDPALTGTTVWDGAVVLSHYLTETDVLDRHAVALQAAAAAEAEAAAAATAAMKAVESDVGADEARSAQAVVQQSQGPHASSSAAALLVGLTPAPCSAAAAQRLPGRVPVATQKPTLHCLELGAGTGAVSLALLACRKVASATITDIPDLLPHLRHNLHLNDGLVDPRTAHIQALQWGPPGSDIPLLRPNKAPFDVVVGSDLIYYSFTPETPHTELLLWTLQHVSGPHTLIMLSLSLHHNPEEVEHFLQLAAERGFEVTRVQDVPEEWCVPDVMVVQLRKLQA